MSRVTQNKDAYGARDMENLRVWSLTQQLGTPYQGTPYVGMAYRVRKAVSLLWISL